MPPEADIGSITVHDKDPDSELPLAPYDVTTLAQQLSKFIHFGNQFRTPTSERKKVREAV